MQKIELIWKVHKNIGMFLALQDFLLQGKEPESLPSGTYIPEKRSRIPLGKRKPHGMRLAS